METNNNTIVVAAFYCFYPFEDLSNLQTQLTEICEEGKLKGTILIAKEGINSTIAGPREGINLLKDYLYNTLKLSLRIEYKESFCNAYPFKKLKVKIKKEILTFNEELDVMNQVGEYLTPEQWDAMLTDPEVVVIDTRNDYECQVGTFKGAINPKCNTFTDLKAWTQEHFDEIKNKKVLMCCTGGIRCEKSTSYYKKLGIKDVYHLKGGILKYLEETNNKNQMWEGECFVFDERFAVNEYLESSTKLSRNATNENSN